ncbi:NUDIX domain-containing protein [Teredinibacter haidensis]|uniref:NUDIX domain-containing protein n=1 Tax=Teredinibacter haidensis TaxID=2731755 RepID=UPI000948D202|nr:NUDIX hydrolase [Teredinibacter haidensis]
MKEIETLDSKVVYQNKWMKVREDRIKRLSGSEGIFGVIEKPDFVVIIPIQDGFVHIVEQYRYPVEKRFWEFPQGSWEDDPEVDHALLAAGELQEETGLVSKDMMYLGHQYLAYGYSNQGYHIYVARDLEFTSTHLDTEEEGLITKKVSVHEFEKMILSGLIKDATTVNAYGLAKLKGAI